jgi:tripartite-type tricarboxylate transporter receptor subunit TctC
MMDRRKALQILTTSLLSACAWPVVAQDRQGLIRIVVPYAAGGQTDAMARLLAASIETTLGTRVIVDNRPGAAALIGTKYVQLAPPNGDTLLFHNSGLVSLPLLQKSATYDPLKDFDAVSMVGNGPCFLMVNESVPARTVPEFLAYARSVPQGIECANSGINSAGHICAMMLEKMADLKLLHVPFKGSAEVTMALISGEVKMQVSVTTDSLNPYIKSGKIRILGVATREKTSLEPNVPTIGEFVPGYAIDVWFGILAPAHTPLAKREMLSAAVKLALADPVLKERFAALYMDVIHRGPREFAEVIAESADSFKGIVRELQLTPQ